MLHAHLWCDIVNTCASRTIWHIYGGTASTPVRHGLWWDSVHIHIHDGTASTPVLHSDIWWESFHTCASQPFMVGQHPHLSFMHIYGVTLSTPVLHAQLGWDSIHTYVSNILGSNTRHYGHTYMVAVLLA